MTPELVGSPGAFQPCGAGRGTVSQWWATSSGDLCFSDLASPEGAAPGLLHEALCLPQAVGSTPSGS